MLTPTPRTVALEQGHRAHETSPRLSLHCDPVSSSVKETFGWVGGRFPHQFPRGFEGSLGGTGASKSSVSRIVPQSPPPLILQIGFLEDFT